MSDIENLRQPAYKGLKPIAGLKHCLLGYEGLEVSAYPMQERIQNAKG